MKIIERKSTKGNETVKVEFEIPISFTLFGKREQKEYADITIENLRLKIRGILRNISRSAQLNQAYDVRIDTDFLEFLGELGVALTETIERVEMDCRNNRFTYEKEC